MVEAYKFLAAVVAVTALAVEGLQCWVAPCEWVCFPQYRDFYMFFCRGRLCDGALHLYHSWLLGPEQLHLLQSQ